MKLPIRLAAALLTVPSIVAAAALSTAHEEARFEPHFNGTTLEGWTSAHSNGKSDWGSFSVNEAEKAIRVHAGK